MAGKRSGIVTIGGNPLTLLGPELQVGDRAPDFIVLDGDLQEFRLSDTQGRIRLVNVVPSLDTPICDQQTRRFNEEAASTPESVVFLTISMDLPFAQNRFCSTAGIDKIRVFSDYRDRSFGLSYGLLAKEIQLLARSIFIIDENNIVRYVQVVPEIKSHPDYEAALNALKDLL